MGENLATVRRAAPGSRFSLYTTLVLGAGMLRALRALHRAGYIHKDVKPSNFCLRTPLAALHALGGTSLLAPGTGKLSRADRGALTEIVDKTVRRGLRSRNLSATDDPSAGGSVELAFTSAVEEGAAVRASLGLFTPQLTPISPPTREPSSNTAALLKAAGLEPSEHAGSPCEETAEAEAVDETDAEPDADAEPEARPVLGPGLATGAPLPSRNVDRFCRAPTPTHAYVMMASESFVPVLIDFGLARRFVDDNGAVRPPRAAPGFRGTTRYAALAAHEGRELSPADDLWSLLYVMIESLTGTLPWRRLRHRDAIGRCKRKFAAPEALCDGLPPIFARICAYLHDLEYGDLPDYDQLISALLGAASELPRTGGDVGLPDWAPGPHSSSRALFTPTTPTYVELRTDARPVIFSDRSCSPRPAEVCRRSPPMSPDLSSDINAPAMTPRLRGPRLACSDLEGGGAPGGEELAGFSGCGPLSSNGSGLGAPFAGSVPAIEAGGFGGMSAALAAGVVDVGGVSRISFAGSSVGAIATGPAASRPRSTSSAAPGTAMPGFAPLYL